MPAASTVKLTVNQFRALGEDPPGVRLELVDGEIEVSPSPAPQHNLTILRLWKVLDEHVERLDQGVVLHDVDIPIDDHNARRPDLLWFSAERAHFVDDDQVRGLPDLAIEVLSPGNPKLDRQTKFELYQRCGIPHYWIVDSRRKRIEAYALRDGRYIEVGQGEGNDSVRLPPFPALTIDLARLWRSRR